VEIIAHRGASADAPENTLAAVQLAWSQDADAVEVDVHLTADERLAVIHDADARRTTGVPRRVQELTLAELQALDAGRWKSPAFDGEPVPALDEVLARVPPGRRVFVELKSGVEAVGALVRAFARSQLNPAQSVIISFDLAVAAAAKRQLARCEVCWILERDSAEGRLGAPELVQRARAAKLDGLDIEAEWIGQGWRDETRAAGLKLYAWTVDDPELARRLVAFGVDGITTNRPAGLRRELGR
jgi:glycerophosphoryl diester phosphodiesterase